MAKMLTRERLAIANPAQRRLRHWTNQGPREAAELVRRDLIGRGTCLPPVIFCDGLVVPVVSWDSEALADRLSSNRGPLLYRAVIADRLEHGRDHLEPAVLRMEAFISLWPLESARRALAPASAYAQAIAAVPARPGADGWGVFECDYYGFTVAEVDKSGARPVVQGRTGPKHPAGGIGHQRRLMEEQLFDVAQRAGSMPAGFEDPIAGPAQQS